MTMQIYNLPGGFADERVARVIQIEMDESRVAIQTSAF